MDAKNLEDDYLVYALFRAKEGARDVRACDRASGAYIWLYFYIKLALTLFI